MMTQKMRVAVVGYGDVGKLHANAAHTLDEVELVGIADPAVAAGSGDVMVKTPCFHSLAELLRALSPDAVVIATPPASHPDLAVETMEAGAACLIEKPMALDRGGAQCILSTARRTGAKLAYGSCYRFLPAIMAAKRIIADRRIGDVVLMRETVIGGRGRKRCPIMPEHHYPKGGPGGFPMGIIDHGTHLVDIFSWLVESPVIRSFGKGNISGQLVGTEHLTVVLENGASGHLLYNEGTVATETPQEGIFGTAEGWYLGGYHAAGEFVAHPNAIHVHGTTGALRIFHYANRLFLADDTGMRELPVAGRGAPYHFHEQLAAFVADIRQNRTVSVPGETGLAALEAVLPAFEC